VTSAVVVPWKYRRYRPSLPCWAWPRRESWRADSWCWDAGSGHCSHCIAGVCVAAWDALGVACTCHLWLCIAGALIQMPFMVLVQHLHQLSCAILIRCDVPITKRDIIKWLMNYSGFKKHSCNKHWGTNKKNVKNAFLSKRIKNVCKCDKKRYRLCTWFWSINQIKDRLKIVLSRAASWIVTGRQLVLRRHMCGRTQTNKIIT